MLKEVIKAMNAALTNLPWWKRILLCVSYPFVVPILWLTWRNINKLMEKESKAK